MFNLHFNLPQYNMPTNTPCQGCNQTCIDLVSSDCINFPNIGELSCLQIQDNITLTNVIEQIEEVIAPFCNAGYTLPTSVNIGCLQGECESTTLDFTLTHIGNSWIFNITAPIGSVIYMNVVQGANVLYTNAANPIAVTETQVNSGVTIMVTMIQNTGNGIIEYFKSYTLNPITAVVGNYAMTLSCTNNSVITTSINNMFQILVNNICDLQTQLNALTAQVNTP